MDLIYDNKMDRADKTSPLKERYESYIGRLSPEDRKVYDDFYQPIIDDFYKKKPPGKELAEGMYKRTMRD